MVLVSIKCPPKGHFLYRLGATPTQNAWSDILISISGLIYYPFKWSISWVKIGPKWPLPALRLSVWKLSRRESLFTFQNYEAVNQVEWYIQISKMYTSRWLVDVLLIASFYIQRDQQGCLLNEFHGPCKNVVKNVLGNLIHVSLKHLQLD